MFWPFKRKIHIPPIIGEKYITNNSNPFDRHGVLVLDTKEGWVLYQFIINGRILAGEYSLKVSTFNDIYKPHT